MIHPDSPDSPGLPVLALAAGAVVLAAVRVLLVALVALVLVLAGWRPAGAGASPAVPLALPPAASVAPVARDWAGRPLERLTVAELRLQARAAGHRALARSGRRADLLAALGAV